MSASGNRLLARVSPAEAEPLAVAADRVTLARGDRLIVPHEPIEHVFFPITSLSSLVTVFADGSSVESGAVGREGMVGIPVVLGAGTTPMQTIAQVGGDAVRIPSPAFREVLDRASGLHQLMHRYIHALFVIASQSAACNRKHPLVTRLARWLLISSDGVGNEVVAITHEYLAVMLGVRRAGVTDGANELQSAGLIRYRRAEVTILDRPRLEKAACECYAVARHEFDAVVAA